MPSTDRMNLKREGTAVVVDRIDDCGIMPE